MFKQNYTILLVEDENCARRLLCERIGKMEQVGNSASAANGLSAQKFLCEHIVDVVFTDIQMPLMNGVELAAFVKEYMPHCHVVFISGHEEFEYARKGIQYGVKEYLSKPVKFGEIVEVATRCFETIEQRRNALLVSRFHQYKELEQRIAKTLISGEVSEVWTKELDHLIVQASTLVSIEPSESDLGKKEDVGTVFRNILDDALPGHIVLRLGFLQDKWFYLVVSQRTETRQLLKAIPEYLERVLVQQVKWEAICEIHSSQELLEMFEFLKKDDRNALIEGACRYMKEHLGEAITRGEVARSVWLSPSYFSLLFKKIKGMGYNEYLTDLRIAKAKQLLRKSGTVSDIAKAVGFCDSRYFSNIFHKKMGCTPSEYRRMILNSEIEREE